MRDIAYLLKDIKLNEKENGRYDYDFTGNTINDIQTTTGLGSLENAIIFSLSTCFNELKKLYLYENYGCKLFDLIKSKEKDGIIKQYIVSTITKISRVNSITRLNIIHKHSNETIVDLAVDTDNGELNITLPIISNLKLYLNLTQISNNSIKITCKDEYNEPVNQQYLLLIGNEEDKEVTIGHCFINEGQITTYLNNPNYTGTLKATALNSEYNTLSSSNIIQITNKMEDYNVKFYTKN